MDQKRKRMMLEHIAADATAASGDRLRALEGLERLDKLDTNAAAREFYADLDSGLVSDEELVAFGLPIYSHEERVQREVDETLKTDTKFALAVKREARRLARLAKPSQRPQKPRVEAEPEPDNVAAIEPRRRAHGQDADELVARADAELDEHLVQSGIGQDGGDWRRLLATGRCERPRKRSPSGHDARS